MENTQCIRQELEELDHLKRSYHKIAMTALKEMRAGKTDLGTPDIEREIWLANKA